MMEYVLTIAPLLLAWVLDRVVGDPLWLPHPVVLFGRIIAWCEHTFNRGVRRRLKGALMAVVLVAGVWLVMKGLLWGAGGISPWLEWALEVLFIFYCLAGTTLVREVREVFRAVDRSLAEGRRQVARIVGRDTQSLSAQEVSPREGGAN